MLFFNSSNDMVSHSHFPKMKHVIGIYITFDLFLYQLNKCFVWFLLKFKQMHVLSELNKIKYSNIEYSF